MNINWPLLLTFRPTGRNPLPWTPMLLALTVLAIVTQAADVISTWAVLSSSPYAIEGNPLVRHMLDLGGWPAFIVYKVGGTALLAYLVHVCLRRGLGGTAYGLLLVWIVFGLLVAGLNFSQLLLMPSYDQLPPLIEVPALSA